MPDQLDNTIAEMRLALAEAIRARIGWQVAAMSGLLVWLGLLLDRWIQPTPHERMLAMVGILVAGILWWFSRCLPMIIFRPNQQQLVGVLAKARPELADSLLAAMQVSENHTTTSNKQTLLLYEANRQGVNQALSNFEVGSAFKNPKGSRIARFAMIAWTSALLFGLIFPSQASLYLKRLALSEEPWPHAIRLIPEGFSYEGNNDVWTKHVARGTPVELVVWADLLQEVSPPETIRVKSLRFFDRKIADSMLRVGKPRNRPQKDTEQIREQLSRSIESQRYRLRLEELSQSLTLRLRGGDDQIIINLIASDRPAILEASLVVTPPSYLGQTSEEFSVAQLRPLPEGATFELQATASKQLSSVAFNWQTNDDESLLLTGGLKDRMTHSTEIRLESPPLKTNGTLSLELKDSHQIESLQSYDLPIEVLADEPPVVSIRLKGIGKLITTKALIPTVISAKDDYGLVEVFLVTEKNNEQNLDRRKLGFDKMAAKSFTITEPIDLELLAYEPREGDAIVLAVGDQLRCYALAYDAYDLADRPPTRGEPHLLLVVSPEELLNHLSERERELRKTLEGILADARRLAYSLERSVQETERASGVGEWLLEANKLDRDLQGIVSRTQDIKLEVINNRLAKPALVDRLADSVISPLQELLQEDLSTITAQLDRALHTAEPALDLENLTSRAQHAVRVIGMVIEAMQSNESYNEVVATLRRILREQKQLNKQTENEQREEVRQLLLD